MAQMQLKIPTDPQNTDCKAQTIAQNNQNCAAITLVGGWERATIPPSSLLSRRAATEDICAISHHLYFCSESFIYLRPHHDISLSGSPTNLLLEVVWENEALKNRDFNFESHFLSQKNVGGKSLIKLE